MTKEYKAKVFKSGNSLALRLPKALGLKEGSTMVLREEQRGYIIEPEEAPKRLDVDKFWGKAKDMIHVPAPSGDFEPRPSATKFRS